MDRRNGKRPASGWTLVEVLVVAAIMVALASFVITAMERALYTADLAVCQAQQRHIGIAVLSYATSGRRAYPHRAGLLADPDFAPPVLCAPLVEADEPHLSTRSYDDRRLLKQLLPIDESLNCPLVSPVELSGSKPRTRIWASQALWFGWEYRDLTGRSENGMHRLGDRFTWQGDSFSVLASDWTAFSREDNFAIGSHPDIYDGIMHPEKTGQSSSCWWVISPSTYSFWVTPETSAPGPVDRTFLFDDGSVQRLERVHWRLTAHQALRLRQRQEWSKADERMVRVPERTVEDPARSTHLPRN